MWERLKIVWDDLYAIYRGACETYFGWEWVQVEDLTADPPIVDSPYPDRLLWSLAAVLLWLLLRPLLGPISRRFKSAATRYSVRKFGGASLNFLLLFALILFWINEDMGAQLRNGLALLSAGLIITLSSPITNIAAWLFILMRHPFRVKDRIQIGTSIKGDVIDIRMFQFSLLEVGNWVDAEQSTGRIIHIPNKVVFEESLANYTVGFKFIWHEVPVTVTFESNWQKAHELLTVIASEQSADEVAEAKSQVRDTSTQYMVYYTRFTPIVWVKVADIGVTLTIRYLTDTRRRRSSESELWKVILRAFAKEADIDFAYPTSRVYYNPSEGKPGAGGRAVRPAVPEIPTELGRPPELPEPPAGSVIETVDPPQPD
jgi:small-conductance mechanosensitive channel